MLSSHSIRSVLTIASVILLTVGCTQSQDSKLAQYLDFGLGIFSNRAQSGDQILAIIKLQTPALLSTAVQKDGATQLDPQQLKAILAEQKNALEELKKLSPEIKILFTYKMVLNGIAFVAPESLSEKIKGIGNVVSMVADGTFGRPHLEDSPTGLSQQDIKLANSVKWIGGDKAAAEGIRGQKIKVGIIDSGVDFTHAMFDGPGTEAAYKGIDPSKPTSYFPNKRVVGGIDLAGSRFNVASGDWQRHFPVPDENPLDEGGHGTHVAGTVAGHGDGEKTYDGVAPDAEIYAIKVFGAEGATSDSVVIAGLEYAADPTGQGTGEGRLDVVNLSLGSPYGNPHILYGEAVKNLVQGGTVMVASAGNEGAKDYIVGAPSIVDEALSVAASVDNAFHNWNFNAIRFQTPTSGALITEAIEGPISKSVAEVGDVQGSLVFAGIGDTDFSAELTEQVKGRIAFMDRGIVMFSKKVKMAAEAGAVGVVIANNQPGEAFSMGGDDDTRYPIPAVMITQALGDSLKAEMKKGDVVVYFQTPEKISKPELIDILTGFSSKGPRSSDGYLKPEITGPGNNIISAAMGKGKEGVAMSGTSMSGPHLAGVMALLRQKYPQLSPLELKSIVMGTAVTISDAKKVRYPVSQQGAGRVQIERALHSLVTGSKVSLSFGEQNISSQKMVRDHLVLRNLTAVDQEFKIVFEGSTNVRMLAPSLLKLPANGAQELSLSFVLDAGKMKESSAELDGWVKLVQNEQEVFRIPMLAVIKKISQVKIDQLVVHSGGVDDAEGSAVDLKLTNHGLNSGRALAFNRLGSSPKKEDPTNDPYRSRGCDLESVGYRIVQKNVDGQAVRYLQFGAKLFSPMTTWHTCELSVLIDADGDGSPEQELAMTALGNVAGLSTGGNDRMMANVLLDAPKVRDLRQKYELAAAKGVKPNKNKEDYSKAVLALSPNQAFNHSTVAMLEVDMRKLAVTPLGELAVKIATIHQDSSSVQMDDFMNPGTSQWTKISLDEEEQSYKGIPDLIEMGPGETVTVELTKGAGDEKLLLLTPDNKDGGEFGQSKFKCTHEVCGSLN